MEAPTPRSASAGTGALWFGLLAAPVAWSLQLLVNYFVVAVGCRDGFGATVLVAHLVSLGALALALAGLGVAHRRWRRAGLDGDTDVAAPAGRVGFMALTGMLSAGLFVLVIVVSAIPPFFVPAC